ncbi:18323_t:CDS:2, partial [Acaulospora morrowiae]
LTVIDRIRIALSNIEKVPAHKISSPPHQKRRASVAIIIRIWPNPSTVFRTDRSSSSLETPEISNLDDFWKLPWVKNGVPEILYIKRALRDGDRWSGQMAFPGGKQDPEDVDDLDTAERETFEEVGFDLGNNEQFICVGALDDLEVTTTFGKKLLMILCPFVFLQVTRESPPVEISGSEIASAHWVPISTFFDPQLTQKRNPISIDLSSRLAPKSWILQNILKTLVGRMHFHCIDIPRFDSNQRLLPLPSEATQGADVQTLRLWGLTLQMTSDLMDMMYRPEEKPPRRLDALRPKFDYWDVNFFIWCFLKNNRVRYRRHRTDFANRRFVYCFIRYLSLLIIRYKRY